MASRGGALILEGIPNFRRLAEKEEKWLRVIAGYVAGMAFGFNNAFWYYAVTVEVWALGLLLFVAVLCLLMRWFYAPDEKRYLYAAGLVYGCTLTTSENSLVAALGLQFMVLLGRPALGRDICLTTVLLIGIVLSGEWLGSFPGLLAQLMQAQSLWVVYSLAAL